MKLSNWLVIFPLVVLALSLYVEKTEAAVTVQPPVKLQWQYYKRFTKCKEAEADIRHQVELYYEQDKSIPAKLLRLLYSDCFVTGCDASILLDGDYSEKKAPQNVGLGAFVLIDKIKTVMEERCPGIVSCADILNLATRDAVHKDIFDIDFPKPESTASRESVNMERFEKTAWESNPKLAGAPSYPVLTGRRDGFTSSAASVDLPLPSISLKDALEYFGRKGLDVLDFVTLMGSHSIGRTHCSQVVDRLYNFSNTGKPDPSLDKAFADQLRKQCPRRTKKGQTDPLVFLNPDSGSSYKFSKSSSIFERALSYKSVLRVDQQLLYTNDTLGMTQEFASNFEDWRRAYTLSMNRMGNINVLTGNAGEIRRNCRLPNKK